MTLVEGGHIVAMTWSYYTNAGQVDTAAQEQLSVCFISLLLLGLYFKD
jgi:hypothetical protein